MAEKERLRAMIAKLDGQLQEIETPCPFCRAKKGFLAYPCSGVHEVCSVRCGGCQAEGPLKSSREKAITAWAKGVGR